MGLLLKLNNGDSQLKSLKFGNDRPGGGDSGQPYIKKGIQTGIQNPSFYNDFVVRGGIEAPLSAAEDVVRLTKYFINIKNPSGLLFTAKQNLLSRVGTKTEASKGLGYAGGALNEGAYTPLSTLAEAGIVWAGGHVNKQGLDPTGLFPGASIKKYGEVVYENNNEKTNSAPPTVPDSLYRKAQRANNRLGNRIVATANQRDKAVSEIIYKPPTNYNGLSTPFGEKADTFLEGKINSFLQAWDAYRDKQAAKNLTNKEQREARASERALTADQNLDEAEFFANNIARPVYSNRLLNLWDTTGLNLTSPGYTSSPVLYSYGGGPNSVLGIGKTNIKFATLNDGATPARTGMNMVDPYLQYGRRLVEYKTTNIFGKTFMPNSFGSVSLTYAGTYNTNIKEDQLFGTPDYLVTYNNKNDLQSFNPNAIWQNSKTNFNAWQQFDFNTQEVNLDSTTKEDFRTILDPSLPANKTFLSLSPSYKRYMAESDNTSVSANATGYGRINLRSPGQKGDISNYVQGKRDSAGNRLGPADFINALPIYKSSAVTSKNEYKNDLIKFRIDILDNDANTRFFMHFRAFLDSFTDSYGGSWKNLSYMGRGEDFYKYDKFSRDINVSFTVAALSKQELIPMYKKLNYLASSLAPDYSSKGYLRGNIAYLTVGAWCYELPGIINSIEYSVPEEAPWEIAIPIKDENGKGVGTQFDDDTVREMPHMIKVTMKFTPIHTFRPEIMSIKTNKDINKTDNPLNDSNDYGNQRYISLETSYNLIKQKPEDKKAEKISLDVPLQPLSNTNTLNLAPSSLYTPLNEGENRTGEINNDFSLLI
jgi:hypothetical protein